MMKRRSEEYALRKGLPRPPRRFMEDELPRGLRCRAQGRSQVGHDRRGGEPRGSRAPSGRIPLQPSPRPGRRASGRRHRGDGGPYAHGRRAQAGRHRPCALRRRHREVDLYRLLPTRQAAGRSGGDPRGQGHRPGRAALHRLARRGRVLLRDREPHALDGQGNPRARQLPNAPDPARPAQDPRAQTRPPASPRALRRREERAARRPPVHPRPARRDSAARPVRRPQMRGDLRPALDERRFQAPHGAHHERHRRAALLQRLPQGAEEPGRHEGAAHRGRAHGGAGAPTGGAGGPLPRCRRPVHGRHLRRRRHRRRVHGAEICQPAVQDVRADVQHRRRKVRPAPPAAHLRHRAHHVRGQP